MRKGIALPAFTFIVLGCILCSSALGGQEYVFVDSWPEEILGLRSPSGVAVDGSGNIYVADNNRIQKFDSEGNFLTKLGTYGSGDGQFNNLWGVAVDGLGNVYVADTFNHRIQVFNPTPNTAPLAGELSISPASPLTGDDLTANYVYFDADGDLESGTEIRWLVDGQNSQLSID